MRPGPARLGDEGSCLCALARLGRRQRSPLVQRNRTTRFRGLHEGPWLYERRPRAVEQAGKTNNRPASHARKGRPSSKTYVAMTSYQAIDRRGGLPGRCGDHPDDRHGYRSYGSGRGDGSALDRYHAPSSRWSKSQDARTGHRRSPSPPPPLLPCPTPTLGQTARTTARRPDNTRPCGPRPALPHALPGPASCAMSSRRRWPPAPSRRFVCARRPGGGQAATRADASPPLPSVLLSPIRPWSATTTAANTRGGTSSRQPWPGCSRTGF